MLATKKKRIKILRPRLRNFSNELRRKRFFSLFYRKNILRPIVACIFCHTHSLVYFLQIWKLSLIYFPHTKHV